MSLRVRGFRATQEFLLRFLSIPSQDSQEGAIFIGRGNEHIELIARMVDAAVRNVWSGSSCLERSLALWWLLRNQGVACELRIGARKIAGKFEAHAWVEHDGIPLNERQEHLHYSTFDATFPSQSSEPL